MLKYGDVVTQIGQSDFKKKRLLFWGLTLSIAVFGCLAVAAGFYGIKAWSYFSRHHSGWFGRSYVQEDPLIGFVPTPGGSVIHKIHPKFSVFNDDRGARVEGIGMKAPESVDILGVGCSFTWGHGVDASETYLVQIQNRSGYRTYNIAVASYGPAASLLLLRRFADLNPKIVIYGFIPEHEYRLINPSAGGAGLFVRTKAFVDFDAMNRPFIHEAFPVNRLFRQYLEEVILEHDFGIADIRWALMRDLLPIFYRKGIWYSEGWGYHRNDALRRKALNFNQIKDDGRVRRRALEYILRIMAEEVQCMDAHLVVLYIPSRFPVKPPTPNFIASREALGNRTDVSFVDMSSDFIRLVKNQGKNALFLPNDGHPTRTGHHLIGQRVSRHLKTVFETHSDSKT